MQGKVFFKMLWLRFLRFVLYTARWLFSCVVIEIQAILLISPVVLLYLTILNSVGRTNQLLGGNLALLWLVDSALAFIPMLISVIVSTIKNRKALKQDKKDTKAE